MKKVVAFFMTVAMLLALTACGNGQDSNNRNYNIRDLDSVLSYMKTVGEKVCTETENETTALLEKLGDSYDSYTKNEQRITEFYQILQERSSELYETLYACGVDYFKGVAAQGLDDYRTWDNAMNGFYDEWDDIMDEYYNAWDDALDDIYDKADDLIEDAYDDLSYNEYSDVWSEMYKGYSDTWSVLYNLYSDAWSETYNAYSACWSGFYEGNTDVDAILNELTGENSKGSSADNGSVEGNAQDQNTASGSNPKTDSNVGSSEVRSEFKEAMDAYEAFYDEYCDILQKYYNNPTDLTLLAEYSNLMTKAVEMDETFAKWESEDLNSEELKYYLEVNNRVMQKLVDVMG